MKLHRCARGAHTPGVREANSQTLNGHSIAVQPFSRSGRPDRDFRFMCFSRSEARWLRAGPNNTSADWPQSCSGCQRPRKDDELVPHFLRSAKHVGTILITITTMVFTPSKVHLGKETFRFPGKMQMQLARGRLPAFRPCWLHSGHRTSPGKVATYWWRPLNS